MKRWASGDFAQHEACPKRSANGSADEPLASPAFEISPDDVAEGSCPQHQISADLFATETPPAVDATLLDWNQGCVEPCNSHRETSAPSTTPSEALTEDARATVTEISPLEANNSDRVCYGTVRRIVAMYWEVSDKSSRFATSTANCFRALNLTMLDCSPTRAWPTA